MPFFFDAAILSRIRSPVTSRSNWAKESSTLSVRQPMLVVVLKACVATAEDRASLLASKAELAPLFSSASEVRAIASTSAKRLRLTDARGSRAFPTSFQGSGRPKSGSSRWTWKASPLSSFSRKLRRPALPRGGFQCPAPPPGQAILNEIRKKRSLRDVPAAVPITRGFPRTASASAAGSLIWKLAPRQSRSPSMRPP